MDLRTLRYFVAVAEELHFTRAAQRLMLDQGTVSTAVRRLERELQTVLLDRTSRHVELTAAGAALLPEARALIAQADRLMTVARAHAGPATGGALRVGLFLGPHAACELTEPILRLFRRRHPGVRLVVVELGAPDVEAALRSGRVDAALTRSAGDDGEFATTALFEEPRVVVVPRSDSLADAAEVGLADLEPLRRRPFVAQGGLSRALWDFHTLGDVWDTADLARTARVRSVPEIVSQVAAGVLACVAGASGPRLFAQAAVAGVTITDVPGSVVGATARADRVGDPLVADFLDTARVVAGELRTLVPGARPPGDP